jgi:glycosyltransferase involved in cell wall biosynthesis
MAYDTFPAGSSGGSGTSERRRDAGRFFYCDTTLFRNLGHFANSCRHLTGEARRRGIETWVFGNIRMEPALSDELAAIPLFRHNSWYSTVPDPLSGWLEAFFLVGEAIAEDLETLRRTKHPGPHDTIYWNSARSGELLGVVDWLQSAFTPESCPRIVMEFGTGPGATTGRDAAGHERLSLTGTEPYLYRYAIRRLRPDFHGRLILGTYDPASSADYQTVLDRPTIVLPLPQPVDRPVRRRPPGHAPLIAFLGHQRPDKGYELVPALVRHLLDRHPTLEILVHNGAEREMPRETAQLTALAQAEARLHLALFPADGARWQQLLDLADLIVLPYRPERFTNAYSAILSEALAQGIPVVVPDRTTLATKLADFGGGGIRFDGWNGPAIGAAIDRAIADFDALGERARAGAERWRQAHGPAPALDAILGPASRVGALSCAS